VRKAEMTTKKKISIDAAKTFKNPEEFAAHAKTTLGVNVRPLDHNHLAEGEVTGHFHGITSPGKVLLAEIETPESVKTLAGQTDKILALTEPGTVEHQEHHPIEIPAGVYTVTGVREQDHVSGIARRVID